MLQPQNRPAGSSYILRFIGAVVQGVANATYPKANGEFSSDVVAGGRVARFLLADATDLAAGQRRLPGFDYDDGQPAGSSPHTPVPGTGILNPTDLDITARTWCQNAYVTVQPLDAATAAALSSIPPAETKFCLDTGNDSGLGTDTGLPVLCLSLVLSAPAAALNLDVLVEVRQSSSR